LIIGNAIGAFSKSKSTPSSTKSSLNNSLNFSASSALLTFGGIDNFGLSRVIVVSFPIPELFSLKMLLTPPLCLLVDISTMPSENIPVDYIELLIIIL
jgi:hypothetical protein